MKTKKNNKKAIIMAIAAVTGTSVSQTSAAARAALADMKAEYGKNLIVNYTYNPFEGLYA